MVVESSYGSVVAVDGRIEDNCTKSGYLGNEVASDQAVEEEIW